LLTSRNGTIAGNALRTSQVIAMCDAKARHHQQ